jgi:cyclase
MTRLRMRTPVALALVAAGFASAGFAAVGAAAVGDVAAGRTVAALTVPALRAAQRGAAAPGPGAPAAIQLVHVQGNVHVIVGAGPNVTVQIGADGILLVDTPPAVAVPQMMAEVRKRSSGRLRYIINTSINPEHVAGNAALVAPADGRGTGAAVFAAVGLNRPAIVAHEGVLNRMTRQVPPEVTAPAAALPTTTYFLPSMDFHFNGEPIILTHQPAAHTDTDSLILFRSSNVVSTGALFTPNRFPVIDLRRGGSVGGLITALNRVLDLTVPAAFQEGGTRVIPGRGRISEEAEVVEYRDMVVIVRDRVQALITQGQTLDQVKAAKPSRDYDGEYAVPNSSSTADAFVESLFRSLTEKKAP